MLLLSSSAVLCQTNLWLWGSLVTSHSLITSSLICDFQSQCDVNVVKLFLSETKTSSSVYIYSILLCSNVKFIPLLLNVDTLCFCCLCTCITLTFFFLFLWSEATQSGNDTSLSKVTSLESFLVFHFSVIHFYNTISFSRYSNGSTGTNTHIHTKCAYTDWFYLKLFHRGLLWIIFRVLFMLSIFIRFSFSFSTLVGLSFVGFMQEEGWPLGLRFLNSRIGLVRNGDISGSVSFSSTMLASSSIPSTDSSSNLDTEVGTFLWVKAKNSKHFYQVNVRFLWWPFCFIDAIVN